MRLKSKPSSTAGREAEVKVILTEASQQRPAGTWSEVDAISERLASSGRR